MFDGTDPVTIILFLKQSKSVSVSNVVSENVAKWLRRFAMHNSLVLLLNTRLVLRKNTALQFIDRLVVKEHELFPFYL